MKLAVKLLKQSDLTFFEPLFRRLNTSRQKSLNLNRSILIDDFYPALGELQHKAVVPVRLAIWGPDAAPEIRLTRSITKEAKNWRLNGEFVHNPDNSSTRFNNLAPDDVALLRFDGAAFPDKVTLIIVSAKAPADAKLHAQLKSLAGHSMQAVKPEDLLKALSGAPPEHPARLLIWDDTELNDLEDAAEGDPAAAARVASRRKVGRDELAKALARAGKTGLEGESLIAQWLGDQESEGHVRDWQWIADEHAISPFDFSATHADGTAVRIEVKTTSAIGPRPFHMSIAEISAACQDGRYDLYRLSGWDGTTASLRIAMDIGSWAAALRKAMEALPAGVRPQSFLVDEDQLTWSKAIEITLGSEDEDEA